MRGGTKNKRPDLKCIRPGRLNPVGKFVRFRCLVYIAHRDSRTEVHRHLGTLAFPGQVAGPRKVAPDVG